MKQKISYRKRRDLALKKFSKCKRLKILVSALKKTNLIVIHGLGRPCDIEKHRIIAYVVYGRMNKKPYEELEKDSEDYLDKHYDHSTLHYHYTMLSPDVLYRITILFRDKIYCLSNEIILHIMDSTGLSTSVREQRTRQGLRKKEKLTDKIHTTLGYDPPLNIVVVEDIIMSNHHLSDSKGGQKMLNRNYFKGFIFGDSKYGTYDLIALAEEHHLFPVLKQDKRIPKKGLSAKARRKREWNGNPQRLLKEIRGLGEVVYGGATRAGLIKTESYLTINRIKDGLLIAVRQNFQTFLRLFALYIFFRKSRAG